MQKKIIYKENLKMQTKNSTDKFKNTEGLLYSYNSLKVKVKNLKIDLENIEFDDLQAVQYDQDKLSDTYSFSSSVENNVIAKDKQIEIINRKIRYYQNTINKIDNVLDSLSDTERKLVELRYLKSEPCLWTYIARELAVDLSTCHVFRNKIINKISNMLFP